MTAAPTLTTDSPTTIVRGLAVPFGVPTLVLDRDPAGRRTVFVEQFDRKSFRDMPNRLPFNIGHDAERGAGWGNPRITDRGVEVEVELLPGVVDAADLAARIRSGLITGLSVGFTPDDDADVWIRDRERGGVPKVLRRNATLVEVSAVSQPAYPPARVEHIGAQTAAHLASEALMAPYRAQRERERTEQRRRDEALLADLDRLAAVRWDGPAPNTGRRAADSPGAGPTPAGWGEDTSGHTVVSVGGDAWLVPAGTDIRAAWRAASAHADHGGSLTGYLATWHGVRQASAR